MATLRAIETGIILYIDQVAAVMFPKKVSDFSASESFFINPLKGGYPIIFATNVFHNSHLIQKCIQNQQQLLIFYTLPKQMRVVKNIRRKDDRITSL